MQSGSLKRFHCPSSSRKPPGLASRLAHLLDRAPVDLARLSEEIRSEPHLEALVIGLTDSLQLSPENLVRTLEQAAIVLGTDRLRVMVYLWSTRMEDCRASNFRSRANRSTSPATEDQGKFFSTAVGPIPELLYLAGFLRWLGLNSLKPATSGKRAPCFALGVQPGQFTDLRNILISDFLALVPVLTDHS
jgi:HD-like signal output (HDOD) protein